ncbi:MAG TPA: sirohydrochlorin chelatase [Streptosporangiaceae bacterium]
MTPLVAVAHGSRDPRAAATVERLMSRVRAHAAARGLAELPVHTAYLGHAAPSPVQLLGALPTGPVVVLPLLLTAAYHSRTDLPAMLRAAAAQRAGHPKPWPGRPGGDQEIRYGDPLGPHPLLTAALERRLAEVGVPADPGTSVVLAAAGSSDPGARATITRLAARWQAERGWRDVLPSYASAAGPTPAQAVAALRATGAHRVVVASYLLAPGRFADQVRDQSVAAGAAAVSGVLGDAPELADVVLTRYAAALARPVLAEPRTA